MLKFGARKEWRSAHLSTVGSPEGLLAIKTNDCYAREPGKITAFTGKIIEKSIKSIDFAVKVIGFAKNFIEFLLTMSEAAKNFSGSVVNENGNLPGINGNLLSRIWIVFLSIWASFSRFRCQQRIQFKDRQPGALVHAIFLPTNFFEEPF